MPKTTTPTPQPHEERKKHEAAKPSIQKPAVLGEKQLDAAAILQRAEPDPNQLRPGEVLALQRQVGNRAVARLLKPASRVLPIQKKLTVGAADDPYEREADQIADQVVNMPVAPGMDAGQVGGRGSQPAAQRQEEEELQTKPLAAGITPLTLRRESEDEEEPLQAKSLLQRVEEEEEVQAKPLLQREAVEEEEPIQGKRSLQREAEEEDELQTIRRELPEEEDELQLRPAVPDPRASFEVGTDIEARLQASAGSGSPLPEETRNFMEPRFGADFSGVRLHTDGEAAELNRSIHAQAFTHGQDIYLGEGKTDLASSSGEKLLAHELTHVVQQGGAPVAPAAGSVQRFGGFVPSEKEILTEAPAGFTLFGKTTYAKIMAEVGKYHKLGQDKYGAQLEQIVKILGMINQWENKHKGKSKGAERKRREMMEELKIKLMVEKMEVRDQSAGNQTLAAGTATADPAIEIKYGIVPDTAPLYKVSDTSKHVYFKKATAKHFDSEQKTTTATWLKFKIGGTEYWVEKSLVIWSKWVEQKGVLFPEEPSVKDVQQGFLGDCYLLAAVTSLVQSGTDKVKDMMRDNGDSVTVRLYDVDTSTDPHTYTARNITVEKSTARLNGEEVLARGSLWVQMLEKAYSAAGYTGDYPSQTGAYSMKNISGGYAWVAMGHLVGNEAIQTPIQPQSLEKTPGGAPALPSGVGKSEWDKIRQDVENMFTGKFLFVESFEAYFASKDGKRHPFGVRQKVLEWISESGLYQHEAGTGRYTEAQIEEFDAIVDLLGKAKLVTLSSNQKIAEGSAGKGFSGGEEMKMGLVGGHEYTVLDYGYGDVDNPQHTLATGTKNAARWFKVRNPWGSYGRLYEWDAKGKRWVSKQSSTGSAEETEAIHETPGGVFWLELGDMTRNFSRYQVG